MFPTEIAQLLAIIVFIMGYLTPIFVAIYRRVKGATFQWIIILTIFLGWTGIVWCFALLFAIISKNTRDNEERQRSIITNKTVNPASSPTDESLSQESSESPTTDTRAVVANKFEEHFAPKRFFANLFAPKRVFIVFIVFSILVVYKFNTTYIEMEAKRKDAGGELGQVYGHMQQFGEVIADQQNSHIQQLQERDMQKAMSSLKKQPIQNSQEQAQSPLPGSEPTIILNARGSNLNNVKFLVGEGVSVNTTDSYGMTPCKR